MEVTLVILEGKYKGRAIPLPETIFLIGRDPQCHLRPHCARVSKLHCAIAAWAGRVRVRDLRSRNGTFLNGKPIEGEVTVGNGDKLQVGSLAFAFQIKDDGMPVAAPLRERDLAWLLESPADTPFLVPSYPTATSFPESEEAGTPEPTTNAVGGSTPGGNKIPGTKSVSAGQHLRDYVNKRTQQVKLSAPPTDVEQPVASTRSGANRPSRRPRKR